MEHQEFVKDRDPGDESGPENPPSFLRRWQKEFYSRCEKRPSELLINGEDETEYYQFLIHRYQRIPYVGPSGWLLFRGIEVIPVPELNRGEVKGMWSGDEPNV